MKLDVVQMVAVINHHATAIDTLVKMLEGHGIGIDTPGITRIGHVKIDDLYPADNCGDVRDTINELLRAAGLPILQDEDPGPHIPLKPEPVPSMVDLLKPMPLAEPVPQAGKPKAKRTVSLEGRKRLAEAQKKRWAKKRRA